MGKARIVSGGTTGLYNVKVLHNRKRINAEIASLNERIAELDDQIAALEIEKAEAEADRDLAQFDLEEAVREYSEARDAAIAAGEPIPEPPDFTPLIFAVQQAGQRVQIIESRLAVATINRLALVKRRQALEAIPEDQTQQAWCADFTEDLSGEVATVEVPGEAQPGHFATWRRLQIRPGYEGRASYNAARDGQLFHRAGQSPEQVYFNAAILPGVQRWRPQYRIGTLIGIDTETDTCSLTLQGENSSAQSLIIDPPNLQYAYTAVPIEYMDCDSQAFEVGDRVLVEFQGRDWSLPKVIGFESDPRICPTDLAIFLREFRVRVPDSASRIEICSGGDPGDCPSSGGATIYYSPELEVQGALGNNHLEFIQVLHQTGFGSSNGAASGGYVQGELAGISVETDEGPAYSQVQLNYYYNDYTGCRLVQGSLYTMCMSDSNFSLIWSPVLSISDITDFVIAGTTYKPVGFMYINNPPQTSVQRDIFIAIAFEPE